MSLKEQENFTDLRQNPVEVFDFLGMNDFIDELNTVQVHNLAQSSNVCTNDKSNTKEISIQPLDENVYQSVEPFIKYMDTLGSDLEFEIKGDVLSINKDQNKNITQQVNVREKTVKIKNFLRYFQNRYDYHDIDIDTSNDYNKNIGLGIYFGIIHLKALTKMKVEVSSNIVVGNSGSRRYRRHLQDLWIQGVVKIRNIYNSDDNISLQETTPLKGNYTQKEFEQHKKCGKPKSFSGFCCRVGREIHKENVSIKYINHGLKRRANFTGFSHIELQRKKKELQKKLENSQLLFNIESILGAQ